MQLFSRMSEECREEIKVSPPHVFPPVCHRFFAFPL